MRAAIVVAALLVASAFATTTPPVFTINFNVLSSVLAGSQAPNQPPPAAGASTPTPGIANQFNYYLSNAASTCKNAIMGLPSPISPLDIQLAISNCIHDSIPDVMARNAALSPLAYVATRLVSVVLNPTVGLFLGSPDADRAAWASQTTINTVLHAANLTNNDDKFIFTTTLQAILPVVATAIIRGGSSAEGNLNTIFAAQMAAWASPAIVDRVIFTQNTEQIDDPNLQQLGLLLFKQITGNFTQADNTLMQTMLVNSIALRNAATFQFDVSIPDLSYVDNLANQLNNQNLGFTIDPAVVKAALASQDYKIIDPYTVEFSSFDNAYNFVSRWGTDFQQGPPMDPDHGSDYYVVQVGNRVEWKGIYDAPSINTNIAGSATESTTGIVLLTVGIVACVAALALFAVHFKRSKASRRVYDRASTPNSTHSGTKLIMVRASTPVEV